MSGPRTTTRRRFLAGTASLLAMPSLLEAAPHGVRGPLVGHVAPTQATIWFYAPQRSGVRVHVRPAGTPLRASRSIEMGAGLTGARTARVVLPDLEPATPYVYRMSVGGGTRDTWKGAFSTPPRAGTPLSFRLATASCMKPDHWFQESWVHLLREKPDMLLLLGDNVYADSTTRRVLWDHHLRMRGVWQFQQAVRHVPTYAVWDDHDFAGDNTDGTAPGKQRSLAAFRELWPNPSFGLPDVPGTFFKVARGDVDFFVLDGRYHRSPLRARNDARKRMLGDAQFAWFAREIVASKAVFKVIASGSTIDSDSEDNWTAYRFDLDRVWGLIRERRIGGVLWLSGDLHESLVVTHPKAKTGFYDLPEVISSGIANSRDHEFAILDFDTTVDDPTVRLRIVNGAPDTIQDVTVRRSGLA